MSLVTPNFDELQDQITPGTYKVIVKKSEIKEWPSGDQYIAWELETVGEAEPKNNGRRIRTNTSISGKGAFMLQSLYRAAMNGKTLTGSFDTEELMGKQLSVDVIDGIRNGEPTGYTEVKRFKSASV